MTQFRIDVVVNPQQAVSGTKRVERELDSLQKKANKTHTLLQRALAFVGVAFAVRQIAELADAYTNLQNRLRVVTEGQAELVAVTEELLQVANRSRSSFESTAELYSRLALATRELNLQGANLIDITESINKAIILSGASAKEANNGLIQLSQGLASGRLTGDELRSTLEQLPVVADVIARQLGVTRGELRKLGAEGKITSLSIIQAFQAAEKDLESQFAKTVPTLSQSFVVLRNNVVAFIGRLNEGTGALGVFGSALRLVGENIDTVIKSLTLLGITLSAVKVAPAVESFFKLSAAIKEGRAVRLGSIAAINAQNASIAANAAANVVAQKAEVERLKAVIFATREEVIHNKAVVGKNAAVLALAATEQRLIPIRAQLTAATKALTAAEIESTKAAAVASTRVTLLGQVSNKAKSSVKALTAVIAANPVGAAVVGLTAVTAGMVIFRDEIELTKDGVGTLGDFFAEFFDQLGTALAIVPEAFERAFGDSFAGLSEFLQTFEFEFADLIRIPALFADRTIGLFLGMFKAIVAGLQGLPKAIGDIFVRMVNTAIDVVELIPDTIVAVVRTSAQTLQTFIRGMVASFGLLGEAAKQSLAGNFETAAQLSKDAAAQASFAFDQATEGIGQKFINNLAQETENNLIPRIENTFKEGFGELGAEASNAFIEGADFSGVRDFVDGLLSGAEQRAVDRSAIEATEQKAAADRDAAIAAAERAAAAEKIIGPLLREKQLLDVAINQGSREADIQAKLITIREKLAESGNKLNLNQAIALEGLVRLNASRRESLALAERLAPAEDILAERTRIAKQALDAKIISLEQYNQELRDAELQAAETGKSMADGLTTGFARIQESAGNVATAISGTLVSAFDSAADALTDLVLKGKADSKEYARAIVAEITKVIAKMLILKAIQGSAGFLGFELPQAQAADGSTAATANKPFLVGEEGPEIFTPGQTGSITPTDQTISALTNGAANNKETVVVQSPSPSVNVNNVIVDDASKVPAAMESADGRQAIRNVIREESAGIKRDLA